MSFQKIRQLIGRADAEVDATIPFSMLAAASTNATLVRAGPGELLSIAAFNQNAAVRYLKFYDIARAPTAGQGTPVRRFAIPGNAAGAGFILTLAVGMGFQAGIAFTMTTGVADTDTGALTANDVVLTLEYA